MGNQVSLSSVFEGLDLGERNASREFAGCIDFLTPDEVRALYEFLTLLRGRLRS